MTVPDDPKPRLICILGPTGVGKTGMALELAGRWGGEIVSADSMQVYRHMDIGTAKPTPEERGRIPHHILDVVDPDEPFDASRYVGLAHGVIDALRRQGKPVFVVGGTGLYVRALLGGLIDGPGADEALRRELKQEMNSRGKAHLYERLRARDPRAADRIDPHDGVRIIRALEVLELTGRSIVEHQQEHRFGDAPYAALRIGLRLDRESLNDRIDRRAEQMIADGFAKEVRRLLDKGYEESLKSMQSLGYRHMIDCLAGRQSLEQTVGLIKRDTRRYAKRQMTWFAADREVGWLDPGDVETASGRIGAFLGR
ncbi:MAG: tRNA (adenosine(37)-N6)-dimethylallyltransferase MiaA [Deltaproteobacteria bacterium]|nr:tRNA (adenosine(37)-N6)-dimethylallyltransferase MiaA [Deltaproteobacteria bacterium]